ncbi:MAG: hypothetical protein JWQ53_773 [Klenkia sp.]|nr:hypothetical protein [Klenkia sp.]
MSETTTTTSTETAAVTQAPLPAPSTKTSRAGDSAIEEVCPVCPHPMAQHDRISRRFCAATAEQVAAGHQTNPGCSCP